MKNLLSIISILGFVALHGQPLKVFETLPVSGQENLNLDFPFADEVILKIWDKQEVLVEVEVSINDDEDNDIYFLTKRSTDNTLYFEMDQGAFEDRSRKRNCWDMEINYTVSLPASMVIEAESISGNYSLEYYGKPAFFKTISGDIDLTIPDGKGLEFKVKTISGEVYTDLDISYPEGKEGLRQVVGTNVRGKISNGGEFIDMETISGNIYLRKG